jgi:hypothetical protein
LGIKGLRPWCPIGGVNHQLENDITHRNKALLCVPFTVEDSAIIVRAASRNNGESLNILAAMIVAGNADDRIIATAVENKGIEEYHAQEEFHAWAQAIDDEDPGYPDHPDS